MLSLADLVFHVSEAGIAFLEGKFDNADPKRATWWCGRLFALMRRSRFMSVLLEAHIVLHMVIVSSGGEIHKKYLPHMKASLLVITALGFVASVFLNMFPAVKWLPKIRTCSMQQQEDLDIIVLGAVFIFCMICCTVLSRRAAMNSRDMMGQSYFLVMYPVNFLITWGLTLVYYADPTHRLRWSYDTWYIIWTVTTGLNGLLNTLTYFLIARSYTFLRVVSFASSSTSSVPRSSSACVAYDSAVFSNVLADLFEEHGSVPSSEPGQTNTRPQARRTPYNDTRESQMTSSFSSS
eukprot:gnl/TRDRNA2_/TRDRNA2_106627_c0_seq1.p1 gnl/TRDRNA2_/TRDRNA2_106627_c0~~gnl/TRDRNA2_/TRDRNA2_106627_c0_seq1.p1  ORF type:complete len:293 (-),score=0.29 gnl/TRDRNA2_/TRDRNA2_106627_c0_seq1:245-1123(-)